MTLRKMTAQHPLAELDVLVPTCGRPVGPATTLAGLTTQAHPFGLVVSDRSRGRPSYDTPPAETMLCALRAAGHRVRVGRHLPCRGQAEHRATLLARSRARYLLFLDEDVWLEPGTVRRLHEAIVALGCGFVGAAVQGLSYQDDHRPAKRVSLERWSSPPQPERVEPGTPETEQRMLHNVANRLHLRPGERWVTYEIAPGGGCVLYDRRVLEECGGFDYGTDQPATECCVDVLAPQRVLAAAGGAGILPSGAYHLQSPTSVPDRAVQAYVVAGRSEPALRVAAGGMS